MKFCPYCGASLMGSAVSFCAKCGKALTAAARVSIPSRSATVKKRKPDRSVQPKNMQRPRHTPQTKAAIKHPNRTKSDDGYDGYYNDVKPIDEGHIRERSNSELVKRVVLIAGGAFVIVILSAVIMYLL